MSKAVLIYHNPRCQKSRTALAELEKSGSDISIKEYLKEVPSVAELKALCIKLQIKPSELVRTSEPLYKEHYKGKAFSDTQWLKIMVENPVLIQRPIVVKGDKAVIAREEGTLTKFLK